VEECVGGSVVFMKWPELVVELFNEGVDVELLDKLCKGPSEDSVKADCAEKGSIDVELCELCRLDAA
jgi:hypothetical protein